MVVSFLGAYVWHECLGTVSKIKEKKMPGPISQRKKVALVSENHDVGMSI